MSIIKDQKKDYIEVDKVRMSVISESKILQASFQRKSEEEALMPEISIVIPVYKCVECLDQLAKEIHSQLSSKNIIYEIVFVDDGSPDNSWARLKEVYGLTTNVTLVKLSRNFGQHAAIRAGLQICRGNYGIVMDCDLQDPPAHIIELYNTAKVGGYDIVYSRRKEKKHSLLRRMMSSFFFQILGKLTKQKIDPSIGSFSVISRKAIDAYLRLRENGAHYLFILRWLGYKSTSIEHTHNGRFSGKSSYTFRSLVKHSLSGLFFQTTVLLRWTIYLGFLMAVSGFLFVVFYLLRYLNHDILPGWTSIISAILLVGGVIICCVGIVGLYIGEIFDHVKNRPPYLIDELKSNNINNNQEIDRDTKEA